ncbi:hypothetical protein AKJ48_02130 [candidate division MSBL1 archaeon SCGC-AAA261O19]|uniref:Uncharacterized protein n=2 Tax=candidate division MSBL1 TaxID=215777 RepID=A0A133V0F4_9EURY|nr:hypothetical protein AKJ42_02170 [candidate division MSBL1 archaeon SCGC-AAA261C02]KXB04576.1 hypothetical protein AKJ48_02130 [candidate division MSBL1 archaeon SCGC-AAA261O19]
MNYRELKELARRVDQSEGEERERLLRKLIEELPELDPFEGHSEFAVMVAKMLAGVKWFPYWRYS